MHDAKKQTMLSRDLLGRDIVDPEVLRAMGNVPREQFVEKGKEDTAYEDYAQAIGNGQTISQPYIVALMTQAAALKKTDHVLEIGTGSGYQAAILAEIVDQVYSVERIPELAKKAKAKLSTLGYKNVQVQIGDGKAGYPDAGPFDAILVTAVADNIPEALLRQLKTGGRMIIPLRKGDEEWLYKIIKKEGRIREEALLPVSFVPLI